jgi:hypothetical protein
MTQTIDIKEIASKNRRVDAKQAESAIAAANAMKVAGIVRAKEYDFLPPFTKTIGPIVPDRRQVRLRASR